MVDDNLREFQAHVRRQLRHFLWDKQGRKAARANALSRIMNQGWRSCLFGGVVRDVVVKSPWVETRDIDIVVADVTVEELRASFADVLVRQTRFGGLTLNIDGWLFDLWPLASTWGFRFFPLFADSFSVLPRTTFFSVEGIAVELSAKTGVPRTIYADRFIESMRARTIMLNLSENPFPELCIVRAFALARKLDFTLHIDLVRHLAKLADRISMVKVERAMVAHYGRSSFPRHELRALVHSLLNHAQSGTDDPMIVPRERQLELSFVRPEPVDHFLAGMVGEDFGKPSAPSFTNVPTNEGI